MTVDRCYEVLLAEDAPALLEIADLGEVDGASDDAVVLRETQHCEMEPRLSDVFLDVSEHVEGRLTAFEGLDGYLVAAALWNGKAGCDGVGELRGTYVAAWLPGARARAKPCRCS